MTSSRCLVVYVIDAARPGRWKVLEEEKKKLRREMAAFIYLFRYGESSGRGDRASFPSLPDHTVLRVHIGIHEFAFTTSITLFLHPAWDGKGVALNAKSPGSD